MKPSILLLVLALVLGGLAFTLLGGDPAGPAPAESGLLPGGGTALAADAGDLRGPASLAADDTTPAAAEREAVVDTDRAKAERKAAEAAAARAAGPAFVGRVFDQRGFPVPDASVRLSATGPTQLLQLGPTGFLEATTTDANGAFEAPRGGHFGDTLRVRVRARGYLFYDEEVEIDPVAGDRSVPVVELEPGVVLAGLVQDAEGRPVEGAEVRRTTSEYENRFRGPRMFRSNSSRSGNVVTDAAGRFVLGNEPEGDYVILVDHDAFPQGRIEGSAPYPGFEDTGLVIELEPTATIAGRIQDFPRGRRFVEVRAVPSEEAEDEELSGPEAIFLASGLASMHSASVEPDGAFLLEGLEPGRSYRIAARVQGGMMQMTTCTDSIEVVSGATDAVLTWDAGATVAFDLVNASTGGKVGGATVRFLWEKDDREFFDFGAKRRDVETSRVELSELRPSPAPGKLSLAISSQGFLDHIEKEIEVDENAYVDLGEIRLEPAPVLNVRVLEAGTGDPLSRARLVLTPDPLDGEERQEWWEDFGIESTGPKSSKGRTEKDGWCALPVSAARTATLKVTRTGYADEVVEGLALPLKGEAEHLVYLAEGGELEVRVLDTNGDPVPKATIDHVAPSGVEGSAVTSRKGKITLKDLETGEYKLRASRPDGGGDVVVMEISAGDPDEDSGSAKRVEQPWERVGVTAGSEQTVILKVPAQTNLRGTLTVNGRALDGAEVDLYRGLAPSEETDRERRWERRMRRWGSVDETKTDKTGRFELEELDIGPHHLRVAIGDGMPDHIVPVDLIEGENRVVADLRTGTLRGRVTDTEGGPIPGARVTVGLVGQDQNEGRTSWFGDADKDGVLTDDDGRFVVEDLPLGEPMKARASAAGFVSASGEPFELAEGSPEAETSVRLESGASIRVTIVGDPKNFERLEAERYDDEGNVRESTSRFVQGSEVVLRNLEPGTWRLHLSAGWGDDQTEGTPYEVEVVAGAEAKLTIQRE